MRRMRNREKGASAIEFALAMPIVFVVLFGIFEFGTALWYQQELVNAVRDGARKGVVLTNPRKTSSYIVGVVTASMDSVGLTDGSRTATCGGSCPCTGSGQTLTVTATYPAKFTVISNLTKLFWNQTGIPASKTLTATISMQCE